MTSQPFGAVPLHLSANCASREIAAIQNGPTKRVFVEGVFTSALTLVEGHGQEQRVGQTDLLEKEYFILLYEPPRITVPLKSERMDE